MRILLTCAAILACAACQKTSEPAQPADTSAEAKAIETVESGQIAAIGERDLGGSTGLYADDAVFIGDDGKAVQGKEAITASFKQFLEDTTRKLEYTAGPKTFSSGGDMAYSTAPYSESYIDPATKKQMVIKGTNLSVWKKQSDGSWKLVADSNAGATAAAE